MPIYEYTCKICNKPEEIIQGFNDPPPGSCRYCGQTGTLQKIVSSSAFHLKGSGWYKDLYSLKTKDPKITTKETNNNNSKQKTQKTDNKKQG